MRTGGRNAEHGRARHHGVVRPVLMAAILPHFVALQSESREVIT